eukprot:294781-Hanusia_phi.AAC.2
MQERRRQEQHLDACLQGEVDIANGGFQFELVRSRNEMLSDNRRTGLTCSLVTDSLEVSEIQGGIEQGQRLRRHANKVGTGVSRLCVCCGDLHAR